MKSIKSSAYWYSSAYSTRVILRSMNICCMDLWNSSWRENKFYCIPNFSTNSFLIIFALNDVSILKCWSHDHRFVFHLKSLVMMIFLYHFEFFFVTFAAICGVVTFNIGQYFTFTFTSHFWMCSSKFVDDDEILRNSWKMIVAFKKCTNFWYLWKQCVDNTSLKKSRNKNCSVISFVYLDLVSNQLLFGHCPVENCFDKSFCRQIIYMIVCRFNHFDSW